MEPYRRVKLLFRQLQINLSMSTWRVTDEHLVVCSNVFSIVFTLTAVVEHTVGGSKTGEGCNVRLEAIRDC